MSFQTALLGFLILAPSTPVTHDFAGARPPACLPACLPLAWCRLPACVVSAPVHSATLPWSHAVAHWPQVLDGEPLQLLANL